MTDSISTDNNALDIAQEAEFQLTAASEYLEWFGALFRAIALNAECSESRDVAVLCGLAKYLEDTGLPCVHDAINDFRGKALIGGEL